MRSCLIVDDSKVVRSAAKKILADLLYNTDEAENGKVAVAKVKDMQPDVVMLDWNMPVMDGLECLKQIRALDLPKQPKVIFCTSENDFDHIETAITAGADEYIMKPFDSDIVRTKFQQLGLA